MRSLAECLGAALATGPADRFGGPAASDRLTGRPTRDAIASANAPRCSGKSIRFIAIDASAGKVNVSLEAPSKVTFANEANEAVIG